MLTLIVGLYSYSTVKNDARKIEDIQIRFLGDNDLFITEEAVNKLLIQNEDSITAVPKEALDLNGLETALKSNPMIKTAEVYLSVNGQVKADIEQRRPIARVLTNASYYIDEDGLFMPLSENRTARVPLVTGDILKNDLKNVYRIARKIQSDEFLRLHVVEIIQHSNRSISLKFREMDFEIVLGELDKLDGKINNLKAFYQKAKKDNALKTYKKVNLTYENQVVCTKK